MSEFKFQIVIPVTNQFQFTKACLDSIKSKYPYEITIIDGGSTDETLPALREHYPNIRVIELGEFKSVAHSWNVGIKDAFERGVDAVVVSNNDVVLAPTTIDAMIEYHLLHPDTFFLQGLDCEKNPPEPFKTTEIEQVTLFAGYYFFMLWRQAWEKVGPFDETFQKGYFEDMDWHLRLMDSGIKHTGLFPAYLFHHNGATANKYRHSKEFDENLKIFNNKWRSRFYMVVDADVQKGKRGKDSRIYQTHGLTKRNRKPKYRILWVSHTPLIYSGFGKVTDLITKHLAQSDEVFLLASNGRGLPFKYDNRIIYNSGEYPNELESFKAVYEHLKPDILITLLPWHGMAHIANHMLLTTHKAHWYNYCSPAIAPRSPIPSWFNLCDHITMNPGDSAILEGYGYKPIFIPHGVNIGIFYPKDFTKEHPRKFTCLYIGRNEARKRIDRLIKAFSIARKEVDIELVLQCSPEPEQAIDHGFVISELCHKYGVGNEIHVVPQTQFHRDESEKIQSNLINSSDLFVTATSIESFGLPILESFACGKPCVVPSWNAPHWLASEGRGYAARIETTIDHLAGNELGIVDAKDFAKGILTFVQDKGYYKEAAEKAYQFGIAHDWRRIFIQWDSLMQSI